MNNADSDCNGNTAFGQWCLRLGHTSRDQNTAIGYRSMYDLTTGYANVAVGSYWRYGTQQPQDITPQLVMRVCLLQPQVNIM